MHALSTLLTDLRHTLRQLSRAKAFALTAILTLALGVGANVVVFGVLDAMLLRPLPDVPQPRQLSFIQHRDSGHLHTVFSFPQYRDFQERNHTFSAIGAYDLTPVSLTGAGHAEQRWAYMATGSYFDLLGVKPYLGRFFSAADDRHGANGSPWAVLSYATWKSDFAGNPAVVGRTVLIARHPFTILGVAPPAFFGTERFIRPALWVDLWNEQQVMGFDGLQNRNMGNLWVIGRRKPGISAAQAQADLNRIAGQLARTYPQTDGDLHPELVPPGYIGSYFGAPVRAFLAGLMLLAALVLAAACANLGGLYAARAADRTRELAIRIALGSSRARILLGLLLESTLLALAGGALGCVLAHTALFAITAYRPPFDFPVAVAVDPSPAVYCFAALLALATGLLCALIPARETARADAGQLIKGANGAVSGNRRRWSLRDVLLLVEVALCCVLVTASFVSLRGLMLAKQLPLGFHPQGVTRISYSPFLAGYTGEQSFQSNQHLLESAAALPGVASAAFASDMPLDVVGSNDTSIYRSGVTDFRPQNMVFTARQFAISPGYLRTAETRLLRGRALTWADDAHAPRVAIVNQTFAQRLFGNSRAIGETFLDGSQQSIRIVGVVENGKYSSLNEPPTPAAFYPAAQQGSIVSNLLIRSAHPDSDDQAQMNRELLALLHKAGPSVPILDIGAWQAALAPVLFPTRAATLALGILGGLALLLAVTGIFGLASYTVSRRMREFGIRVAVGAPRRAVLQAALGRISRILIVGSVAGILLGLAGSRVLAAIVYGASAFDPLVLLAVCCTMLLVGLLSVALPARRAMLVEPAILLRED
jgi:predicted permease